METVKEIYADGVETIHLFNATVRLDMFSLQPPEEGGKPFPKVFERIVMPVQSFLDMHSAMQKIVNQMVQDGLVKQNVQEKNNWNS